MRIWLAKSSGVPIREQLVTQITLGILSADLAPGERLPSVREVARRFKVHANTVSSAYQVLVDENWLEFRKGSGVYVRAESPSPVTPELKLDRRIGELFSQARQMGLPEAVLRERLRQWLQSRPPHRFVVVEPDAALREIVVAEVRNTVSLPVSGCDPDDCRRHEVLDGAVALVLPSKAERAKDWLPPTTERLVLKINSIPASIGPWLPAVSNILVGVASTWPQFISSAHTMLTAAGFSSDALVLRDANKTGWRRGLRDTAAVVCDSVTGQKLPPGCRSIPFRLLAEASQQELRQYEEFLTTK